MPYCPKCDMEFVEGITTCSDCGGPLMESLEAAELLKAEQLRKEKEEMEKMREDLGLRFAVEPEDLSEFDKDVLNFSETPVLPHQSIQKAAESRAENRAYMTKRQRYEDTRSSLSAFFLLGGILLVSSVLCSSDIINLPIPSGSAAIIYVVLAVMGIGCLVVAFFSKKSSDRLRREAEVEDTRTKELTTWFTDNHQGAALDEILLNEDPSLDENELYLKRFELIQDRLVTAHDLPNQSYVDYLCEEIYSHLYERD